MFYYLVTHFIPNYKDSALRLMDYTSFRASAALITSLLICLLLGPATVRLLKRLRTVAPGRLDGLIEEKFIDRNKDKTPSMGGILLMGAIIVSVLLWGNLANSIAMVFLAAAAAFTALGFADDFSKVIHAGKGGISAKTKLFFQFLISFCALYAISKIPAVGDTWRQFCVPFVKTPLCLMPAAVAFIFGIIVVTGSSNAVNLTDGKDGLAVGCTIACVMAYGAIAYMSGHKIFADYLDINFILGASEVLVLTAAMVGGCIGFLWYNCYPASMFMGDTGSLALGGSIGLIAVLVKQEILLIVVGGVFLMEIVSVMIQVTSFRLFGKRVFLMTPIHHHFEKLGWKETQIVVRFWIIGWLLAIAGLATLKLR